MAKLKFSPGDRIRGNETRGSFWSRTGTVRKKIPGKSEYWVMFDDGLEECVPSSWIDLELSAACSAACSAA
jgi:hypothetical protein